MIINRLWLVKCEQSIYNDGDWWTIYERRLLETDWYSIGGEKCLSILYFIKHL